MKLQRFYCSKRKKNPISYRNVSNVRKFLALLNISPFLVFMVLNFQKGDRMKTKDLKTTMKSLRHD